MNDEKLSTIRQVREGTDSLRNHETARTTVGQMIDGVFKKSNSQTKKQSTIDIPNTMALQEDPIVAICKFNETAKQFGVKL